MSRGKPDRIAFLDGLRGIAISGVVLYHCYGPQFSSYFPFGDTYADLYPVHYGWAGVELFFLISGFVILMTLEKSAGIVEFAKRRWLRLFPAMLVCSAIIFAYDNIVGVGPAVDRGPVDLLPGLLFISPSLIHTLTRFQTASMDGPFWSLYVEVVFYAVFGISYFVLGRYRAIILIFAMFVLTVAALRVSEAGIGGDFFGRAAAAADWLGFIWFGWFASGAVFYLSYRSENQRLFWVALALAFVSALAFPIGNDARLDSVAALFAVSILFATALRSLRVQAALGTTAATFMGFVSYPLYLVHSNIAIGSTKLLAEAGRMIPSAAVPLIPIAVLIFVSWIIARYLEPTIRRALRSINPLLWGVWNDAMETLLTRFATNPQTADAKLRQYLNAYGCQVRTLDTRELVQIAKTAFNAPGRSVEEVFIYVMNLGSIERGIRIQRAMEIHWPIPTGLWPKDAPSRVSDEHIHPHSTTAPVSHTSTD